MILTYIRLLIVNTASVLDPYVSSLPESGLLSSMTGCILSSEFFVTGTYILSSSLTSIAPNILTFSPTSELLSFTPYILSSSLTSTATFSSTSEHLSSIPYTLSSSPTSTTTNIPSFSPTLSQPSNSASNWATYLIISIAVSIVVLLCIASVIIIILCLKRRKNKNQTR